MPVGTPLTIKCPKCHGGQYGYSPPSNGQWPKPTGRDDARDHVQTPRARQRRRGIYWPPRRGPVRRVRAHVVVDPSSIR